MSRLSTRCAGRAARGAARAGFTLIELLTVLVILSILAYFLITNLAGAQELMEEKLTRTQLTGIATALQVHSDEQGDYPPSKLPEEAGGAPNDRNVGAEALYMLLCREGAAGYGTLDEELCNTDGDAAARRVEGHQSLELFELADAWGNPIAYIHHRDYGREQVYVTRDPATGEERESVLRAARDETSGRWHKPRSFQLVSAGANGVFGTLDGAVDDDIRSFGK